MNCQYWGRPLCLLVAAASLAVFVVHTTASGGSRGDLSPSEWSQTRGLCDDGGCQDSVEDYCPDRNDYQACDPGTGCGLAVWSTGNSYHTCVGVGGRECNTYNHVFCLETRGYTRITIPYATCANKLEPCLPLDPNDPQSNDKKCKMCIPSGTIFSLEPEMPNNICM